LKQEAFCRRFFVVSVPNNESLVFGDVVGKNLEVRRVNFGKFCEI
jgi:hypothetical protein